MINIQLFVLLAMIFCHVYDDYHLQGILASMKQKKWWEENAPDKKYRYDYKMALFMHSFSWSFMIMLPLTIYCFLFDGSKWGLLLYTINLIIHYLVDDLKANKRKINLIIDQLIHLIQIFVTWLYIVYL